MIENMYLYLNHIFPHQCRYCEKYGTDDCECEIENCECKNYQKERC